VGYFFIFFFFFLCTYYVKPLIIIIIIVSSSYIDTVYSRLSSAKRTIFTRVETKIKKKNVSLRNTYIHHCGSENRPDRVAITR
jgi:hypothetical protein